MNKPASETPASKARTFQMRVDDDFFDKLDQYRREQPDLPSRSEAIRRLVEKALD